MLPLQQEMGVRKRGGGSKAMRSVCKREDGSVRRKERQSMGGRRAGGVRGR